MDERTLQALSNALTLLIFRNGAVENLHAERACMEHILNFLAKYYGQSWDKAKTDCFL